MDVYLELPGHATASGRAAYRHWLEVRDLQFERPVLERRPAGFTVYKMPDALSHVLLAQAASGQAFTRVRIHRVEGHETLGRLRFEQVRVAGCTIDGSSDQAMECVQFRAECWQPE